MCLWFVDFALIFGYNYTNIPRCQLSLQYIVLDIVQLCNFPWFCLVESLLSELDSAVSSRQQPNESAGSLHDSSASSATKELDDLMASLSDFKVNVQTVGPAQSVRHNDDYAKPQKATSLKPSPQGLYLYNVYTCNIINNSWRKDKRN